jgi:hypothetical protein
MTAPKGKGRKEDAVFDHEPRPAGGGKRGVEFPDPQFYRKRARRRIARASKQRNRRGR